MGELCVDTQGSWGTRNTQRAFVTATVSATQACLLWVLEAEAGRLEGQPRSSGGKVIWPQAEYLRAQRAVTPFPTRTNTKRRTPSSHLLG